MQAPCPKAGELCQHLTPCSLLFFCSLKIAMTSSWQEKKCPVAAPANPELAVSAAPMAPAFKNSKFLPLHGKKPRIAVGAEFPRSLVPADGRTTSTTGSLAATPQLSIPKTSQKCSLLQSNCLCARSARSNLAGTLGASCLRASASKREQLNWAAWRYGGDAPSLQTPKVKLEGL